MIVKKVSSIILEFKGISTNNKHKTKFLSFEFCHLSFN